MGLGLEEKRWAWDGTVRAPEPSLPRVPAGTQERGPLSRKDKLSVLRFPGKVWEVTSRGTAVRSSRRRSCSGRRPAGPLAHLHVYTSVRSLQVLHLT